MSGVWGHGFRFRMYLELRRLVVVKRGNVLHEVAFLVLAVIQANSLHTCLIVQQVVQRKPPFVASMGIKNKNRNS